MTLDTPAPRPAPPRSSFTLEGWVHLGILLVFGIILALVLPEHEPWTDEAQSWLLARDASIWDLLTQRLRYEGTPALWTLLLSVPAKLGLPYESMQLLGAICGFGAVALLVLKSPFPLWLRTLLPFTYFLGYQYVLVARNYCLLGLLLFATACASRQRQQKYWPFALGIGLVSHVTLHATLFAGALWLVEVGRALVGFRRDGWLAVRLQVYALAALAVNFWVILFQLWPPADLFLRPPYKEWDVRLAIVRLTTEEAFINPAWLGAIAIALLLPMFWKGRSLAYFLLGTSFVYALLALRYFSAWHTGTIYVFLVFCAWVAFDQAPTEASPPWPRWLAWIGLGGIALFQIPGTYAALRRDYELPYSSSREAAAYIRQRGLDRRVLYGFDIHSCAVLPYFDRNIFANFRERSPASYWIWNRESLVRMQKHVLLAGRPEFILITKKKSGLYAGDLTTAGYTVERTFPGAIFWRAIRAETDDLQLYRRSDLAE